MLVTRKLVLNRSKTLGLLEELGAMTGNAISLYLPPGLPSAKIEASLQILHDTNPCPEDLAEIITHSGTGAVLFQGEDIGYYVQPPFPVEEYASEKGYCVKPLHAILERDYLLGFILVRLGAYAVGVSRGERLVESKVGTGLVHSRHKKGGSSQGRFARHREKQMEYFFTRVCTHAREKLEPYAREMDYLVYGGARTTILSFQKQCHFLGQFSKRLLPPQLDIPEPRKAVLETALARAWSSNILEWHESKIE